MLKNLDLNRSLKKILHQKGKTMRQKVKTTNNYQFYIDYLGEWNPQLFREIVGKLKGKNLIITVLTAILTQFLLLIAYLGKLPDASYEIVNNSSELIYYAKEQSSRYCTGTLVDNANKGYLCHQDLLNHWVINWQLFWFDIFVTFSLVGIALLLIIGTYLLVTNALIEKKQGTLNLIRLSPQPAGNILLGKILGVPILLYIYVTLGLPLQIVSGLQAQIPLSLLIAFDLAILASCGFFYSFSLLLSLVIPKSINAVAITTAIAVFLLFTTQLNLLSLSFNSKTALDWLLIFNPNNLIIYLGQITGIPNHHLNYSDLNIFSNVLFTPHDAQEYIEPITLKNLLFYGQALWTKTSVGISMVILNYCLWTYWIWQSLKRHFYNSENTIISKQQSYWITGYFVAISLGFTLQTTASYYLFENFIVLQCLLLILFLGLIIALSPQQQTLEDWARYGEALHPKANTPRNQKHKQTNILWRELLLGEKSPSTVAIAINLLIATLYIIPSLVIFPFGESAIDAFWSLILSMGAILCYSAIAQWLLLMKNNQRVIFASATILALIVVPPLLLVIAQIIPETTPLAWLFTFLPSLAIENATLSTIAIGILGQWLTITLVTLQITKKLRQAGRSQTYRMLDNKVS